MAEAQAEGGGPQLSEEFGRKKHIDHGEIFHDMIFGFADGLTVPFALTAGLS